MRNYLITLTQTQIQTMSGPTGQGSAAKDDIDGILKADENVATPSVEETIHNFDATVIPAREAQASLLSRLFISWIDPILAAGSVRQLAPQDLCERACFGAVMCPSPSLLRAAEVGLPRATASTPCMQRLLNIGPPRRRTRWLGAANRPSTESRCEPPDTAASSLPLLSSFSLPLSRYNAGRRGAL